MEKVKTKLSEQVVEKSSFEIFNTLLFYFLTFSVLGWLIETVYGYLVLGYFPDRGFFSGPVCPIYGTGAIAFIWLLKSNKNPAKLIIVSILFFTLLEYFIGFCLDATYNAYLWDYSEEVLNINGRVCLSFSLAWGVMAIIFKYLIYPVIEKIANRIINKKWFIITLYVSLSAFIFDVIYTFITYKP